MFKIIIKTKTYLVTTLIIFGNFYELDAYLKECNAYDEPDVAKLKIIDRIGTKS